MPFGDWLSWDHSQVIWGRRTAMPWQTVIDGLRAAWHVLHGHTSHFGGEFVDAAFLVAAVALVVVAFR